MHCRSLSGSTASSRPPHPLRPRLVRRSGDWASLQGSIASDLHSLSPALYPDITPLTLYYDGNRVKIWPTLDDFLLSQTPSTRRCFSIEFNNPALGPLSDPTSVAQVSILNKADELARGIGAITAVTQVKDVIVVAHSQGGLVTRAYIENQAVPLLTACSDLDNYASCTVSFRQACMTQPGRSW